MNPISKLSTLFADFPGIGPRQAKRFVYFLLSRDPHYLLELSRIIAELKKSSTLCASCFRFYAKTADPGFLCSICNSVDRDRSTLLIVEKDVDLENIERSGLFTGTYFILGGRVPILEKKPLERIRGNELLNHIQKKIQKKELREIILALSLTRDGEYTMEFITAMLQPITRLHNVKLSSLGRGLSTGIELEYSDSETLKNALNHRI
ncbi:MAG: recombination protein RecR [Parcubacteria group bacterium Gr01-1014_48]|nr:MAG: recombination protein RecR [Parcubacteria group bacterium Greene0416_14]TSC74216.1 MAG: recombination protein RecR [Parcubacteria group bacterium Gr01-1014_48]TSD01720.1 MAG: recombination protein RecR [Parcubacteria group bacterium Greene1014_15]TSD07790.1 MAG: recombination protein RecR [Parcubacteria group bacterium Greene0714_4]